MGNFSKHVILPVISSSLLMLGLGASPLLVSFSAGCRVVSECTSYYAYRQSLGNNAYKMPLSIFFSGMALVCADIVSVVSSLIGNNNIFVGAVNIMSIYINRDSISLFPDRSQLEERYPRRRVPNGRSLKDEVRLVEEKGMKKAGALVFGVVRAVSFNAFYAMSYLSALSMFALNPILSKCITLALVLPSLASEYHKGKKLSYALASLPAKFVPAYNNEANPSVDIAKNPFLRYKMYKSNDQYPDAIQRILSNTFRDLGAPQGNVVGA